MNMEFAYTVETNRPFAEVAAAIEDNTAKNKFRVLAVHDVQETLAEKGIERNPLKIIEVCNAKFAHEALGKNPEVALFMPCRIAVYGEEHKTIVKLAKPPMIALMMPEAGLNDLANGVEATLKKVVEDSI